MIEIRDENGYTEISNNENGKWEVHGNLLTANIIFCALQKTFMSQKKISRRTIVKVAPSIVGRTKIMSVG